MTPGPTICYSRVAGQLGAKAMNSFGSTRPGLLCAQFGEPFTLSRARPDASRIEDLPDPFQATCPECDQEAIYRKSDIQIMVAVDGPNPRSPSSTHQKADLTANGRTTITTCSTATAASGGLCSRRKRPMASRGSRRSRRACRNTHMIGATRRAASRRWQISRRGGLRESFAAWVKKKVRTAASLSH
jgi:hypothetical protein